MFPYRPQNFITKSLWIVFIAFNLIWTCFAVCIVGLILLPLRFFNIGLYQILESQMWRIGGKLSLFWSNLYADIKFKISGDYDHINGLTGNHLTISSHVSSADWFIHLHQAARNNTGNLRFFLKSVLKNIPILGWCCYLHDCIFLERDLKIDQPYIKNMLGGFIKNQTPLNLILYAEGTYTTPNSGWLIEKNRDFSLKNNLPVFENCLMPRTTGFELIMETREVFDYVTDVTIAFDKPYAVKLGGHQPPTMVDMFIYKEDEPVNINLHYRIFKTSDLPKDRKGLSEWMVNLFKEKDELLKDFEKTGKFPGSKVYEDNYTDLVMNYALLVLGLTITGYWFYLLLPTLFFTCIAFNLACILLVIAYDASQQKGGYRPSKVGSTEKAE